MAATNVKSPTAGVVTIVHKSPGETIALDEELLVIECMKMEIPIAAPATGRLSQITVKAGDAIVEDQVIAVIESA